MTRGETLDQIRRHQDELKARFGVERIFLFGSVARDEAGPESDIDIMVEYLPQSHPGLIGFLKLQDYLSQLLGHRVDLVTPGALKPQLRDQILRELVRAA